MSIAAKTMKHRIYTRSGDEGRTGLLGGERVFKDHSRICLLGEIDELSSVIGLARSETPSTECNGILRRIQNELSRLATELAAPESLVSLAGHIEASHVERIEGEIDRLEFALPPLRQFVLPGGCRTAATLHLARCVCRRVERSLVSVQHNGARLRPVVLQYFNRLADLLFVLARSENKRSDTEEFVRGESHES